jgi:hypothetical protein
MLERHAVLYWKRLLEKRKEDYLKEKRRLFERKE